MTAAALRLVVASVLWGTTGTAAALLPDSVSPLATGAATMGLGGAVLAAISWGRARGVVADRSVRRWLIAGGAGVVVYPLAFYTGMDLAGVAIGNVVALGSGPLFAALLERVVERHPLSRAWAVSTALALAGLVLLASIGRADAESPGSAIGAGVGIGLVAGAAYALYTYSSTRLLAAGHGPRGVMGAVFGVGAVGLLPVLAVTGGDLVSTAAAPIVAYLVLGPMVVAYLLFGSALRRLRSSTATTITLLEPVVATVLAVLVVGERLTAAGWVGLALVLAGIVVLVTARRPRGAP